MSTPQFRYSTRGLSDGIRRLLQEFPARAKAAMTDVGHYLKGETQKRTPVDEGNLTNDVSFVVIPYKSSSAVCLFIPSNAPSSKYAVWIHEGEYNLGPNSRLKQAKSEAGIVVGRKYITRAIMENQKTVMKIIEAKLKTSVTSGGSSVS